MNRLLLFMILLVSGWQINAQSYCTDGGPTSTFDSNVEQVDLAGETSSIAYIGCQAGGIAGVEDQTSAQVADLVAGNTYTLDVQFGTCGGNYQGAGEAWIDFNQDFIFQPGESVGTLASGTPPFALSSFTITVPSDAINGASRLRVMQQEGGNLPLDPCASFAWGSVVDLGITITGGVDLLCQIPYNPTFVSASDDAADFSWDAEPNAINGYLYEVYNQGDDPDSASLVTSGTFAAGTTTGTVTGLSAETDYDMYLASDCDTDGISDFNGPVSFTTLASCTLPSTFEVINVLPDSAELSWSSVSNATDGYNWAVFNAGDDPATDTPVASGTAVSGDTSVVATGLTDSSDYEAYITTDCGATDGLSGQSDAVPFTTPCTIFTAPYFNDFEALTEPTSDCWTENSTTGYEWEVSTTDTPSTGTGPNQAQSGANFVFTEATSGNPGDEALFVSPIIDLSALSSPALSFWFHMHGGDMGTLNVDVDAGSGYDLAVFTLTGEQQPNQDDPWIEQLVDLSAYAGQSITIRFRGERGDGFTSDMAIDDVGIDEAPPCLSPTGLSVSNIGINSVDISWSPVGSASVGYNWLVFADGADPDVDSPLFTGSVGSGTTTASITGLSSSTEYDVYIQSDCGSTDGLSELSAAVSFLTLCDTFIPDYLESFDSYLPTCWDEAGSGDPTTGPSDLGESLWLHDQFLNGTGADNAVNINLFTNSREDWLISPTFDLSGGVYVLQYIAAITDFANSSPPEGNGMGSDDEVQVLITEDDGLTWTTLRTYDQSSFPSETGDLEIIDLSAYTGNVRFAFWGTDGSVDDPEDYDFFIDEFEVKIAPDCLQPLNLSATNETTTTIDISWDNEPNASSGYIWSVFNPGDDPLVDAPVLSGTVAAGVNTETITGLNSSTTYVVYIQSDCGATDGVSDFSSGVEFQTLCDVFVTPYFEDFANFEVTTSFEEDECWEEVSTDTFAWDVTTGTTPSGSTGPDGALFGDNYIFTESSSGSTGDEAIILTPEIDLSTLTTPSLSFWYHMYGGDMGTLHVDVDDGTNLDLSVFSISGQQQTDNSDPWVEEIIDLSAYAGLNVQVRFRVERGDGFNSDVAIDGVRFDELPSCFAPLNIAVTNITQSTADFSWDAETTATDGYNWFVFNAGDDPDVDTPVASGSVASDVTSVTVSGLSSSSFLEFYVQSDCGSNTTSQLSVPFGFETLCDVFPTPYFEDFANFPTTTSFENEGCWTEVSPGGFAWDIGTGETPSFNTGPDAAEFGANYIFTESSSGDLGDEAIVLTPQMDLSNLTEPALSFWYHMFGEDMGTLHVDVDDGTNLDLSVFSISGEQQTSDTDAWIEQFVDLSAYAGQTIQVRFRVERGDGFTSDVAIDGVNFDEAPPCLKPTGLVADSVFFDSAEVSWSPVGNASDGYIWAVYNAGDDPAVDTPVSTGTFPAGSTQGTVDGLAPETDYDIYIESDCGSTDGTSGFANPISITTTPLCSEPSTFEVINILPDSAELSWSSIPNATNGYNWAVFNAGDDPATDTPVASGTAGSGDTSVVATGLTDNSDYEAYITTDCGATDGLSDQSDAVAFTTPCTIFTAPYFNDFEALTEPSSDCWTENSSTGYEWEVSTTDTPSFDTGPNQAQSGTNFVFTEATSGSQGDEALFMSPIIDLSALSSPALSFWFHMHGDDMGTLNVDVDAGSGYDLAVFSVTGEQQPNQDDPWIEQFVDLSAYAGQVITIRFRGERGDGFTSDMAIDDVSVDEAPPCLTPTGLSVSNIGINTIDISWSSVGNASSGYNWLVFNEGDDPDVDTPVLTGSVGAGVTTASISGLSASTAYEIYIQSDCGATDGLSELSPAVGFDTLCDVFVAPYFTDFEAFAPTTTLVEDECWTEVSTDAFSWDVSDDDTPSGGTGPNQAFSGTNFIFSEATSGSLGDEALITSPQIDLSALSVPSLSFWYHMFGGDMGVLHVDVDAGSGYDLDVFTLTGQQQANQSDDWIQHFVDLTAYSGQTITIRLRAERGDGFESDISIDDFRVDEAPTCFDPNNLEVLSVTDTTADLNWVAGSTETIFDVEVVTAGSAPTGVPTFEDVTVPFTATGLTAETDYEFYVRADCGAGDVSNWVGPVSFTTSFTPTTVVVNAPAINNTYCYDNDEFKEWLFVASDGTTAVEINFFDGSIEDDPDSQDRCRIFNGFDANAPLLYDTDVDGIDMTGVQLIADSGAAYILLESDVFGSCQSGVQTLDPLDFDVFAGTVSTVAFSKENFNYYPNPVSSTLSIESANPVESVKVYDILGKEVFGQNYEDVSLDINMDRLSSGTYLMKVTISGNTQTFKVIKE